MDAWKPSTRPVTSVDAESSRHYSKPEPLLSMKDVVEILGVSRRTIYNNPFLMSCVVKVGGLNRWHPSDLRLYLARQSNNVRQGNQR